MTDMILAGRYAIQQELNQNKKQRIFLARDLETGALVVLKSLICNEAVAWDDLTLFEWEAKFLKVLEHPGIPRCLNYLNLTTEDGYEHLVIVENYTLGNSLKQYLLSEGPFSEAEVKTIAKALLDILIYLHGYQPPILHRDIKPSNIVAIATPKSRIDQIFLVNFGAIQPLASSFKLTTTIVGTYGYMSPEQLNGKPQVASDLYSLGMTLIHLGTGIYPSKLPYKNLRVDFSQFPTLSPSWVQWLKTMTEPIASERFDSAKTALQALEIILEEDNRHSLFLEEEQTPESSENQTAPRKSPQGRVRIFKTNVSLDITVNQAGLYPAASTLGWLVLSWFILLLLGTLWLLSLPWGTTLIIGILVALAGWAMGLGIGLFLLFICRSRVRLRVNRKQISLTYELLGRKYAYPQPSPFNHISRIQKIGLLGRKGVKPHPRIVIWARNQQYELGRDLL
ncbi:MAG: serine/threonine-protein kinase, partial [Leptolyngbyaceae bacterium]|nr:serine/threonine-protein kinase [Leptolyngbyaceae bacterium]